MSFKYLRQGFPLENYWRCNSSNDAEANMNLEYKKRKYNIKVMTIQKLSLLEGKIWS